MCTNKQKNHLPNPEDAPVSAPSTVAPAIGSERSRSGGEVFAQANKQAHSSWHRRDAATAEIKKEKLTRKICAAAASRPTTPY